MVLTRTSHARMGLRFLWLSAVIVTLDQVTKQIAVNALDLHQRIPVIPGIFDWTLAYNKGVAFSMFNDGLLWQRYALAGFAIAVSIALLAWMARLPRHEKLSAISLALIVGGAIGNVIDRLRLGQVVDFILWYWRDYHWPAFNVADSAIVVGAILLVLSGFMTKKPR